MSACVFLRASCRQLYCLLHQGSRLHTLMNDCDGQIRLTAIRHNVWQVAPVKNPICRATDDCRKGRPVFRSVLIEFSVCLIVRLYVLAIYCNRQIRYLCSYSVLLITFVFVGLPTLMSATCSGLLCTGAGAGCESHGGT